MKILVTGFEPFDGLAINPSAQLLDYLNKEKFPFELSTLLLPVTFETSFIELQKKIETTQPDYVIMTGLAQMRQDMTIEKIAINYLNARNPDNLGLQPKNCKIEQNGPDGIFSTLPWEDILEWAHKERVPIQASFSAGTYVCNDLFYKCMHKYSGTKMKAGFIHLPATEEVNPLGPFFPKHELFTLFGALLKKLAQV